jgi:AcrR family transcriptional regulator
MPTKRKEALAQAERSAAMRARLVRAARESLLDSGYGRTTAVEVCARAGVTRGALFHHFTGLSELFAATLDEVIAEMHIRSHETAGQSTAEDPLSAYIDSAWSIFGHRDFKIVIEVWLAAKNDPSLRGELETIIDRIRKAETPELNPSIAGKVGRKAEDIAFYRLVLEAMIGMALGRAVSLAGKPMGHEKAVVKLLKDFARERRSAG